MASSDGFPDEFEGIDFDIIPELSAPTLTTTITTCVANTSHFSNPGSPYSCNDNFDAEFLAEVDILEKQATSTAQSHAPGPCIG